MSVAFGELISGLNGKQCGDWWLACCPAHDDRTPSLSFKKGDRTPVILHCHAGCTFGAIAKALQHRGLWPVEVDQAEHPARHDTAGLPPGFLKFDTELRRPEKGRVERYLRQRGIEVAKLNDIAYHPKAFHAPTNSWWPAMVAAVRDVGGHVRSFHRTFLSYTEPPTKAPIEPNRMLWGSARGCAIRLASAGAALILGEGIETTASAMKLCGLPGWSAMSATNLRHVELPECVREVVVAADHDRPGIAAAIRAAQRFRREGRQVRVIKSSRWGEDFNDLLLRGHTDERN